jgi:hypothetical protein
MRNEKQPGPSKGAHCENLSVGAEGVRVDNRLVKIMAEHNIINY